GRRPLEDRRGRLLNRADHSARRLTDKRLAIGNERLAGYGYSLIATRSLLTGGAAGGLPCLPLVLALGRANGDRGTSGERATRGGAAGHGPAGTGAGGAHRTPASSRRSRAGRDLESDPPLPAVHAGQHLVGHDRRG